MAKRGRKKGSTCFVDLTYEQLGDYVGRKAIVKVSKVWLETLVSDNSSIVHLGREPASAENEDKIQYTLTNFNNE